MDEKKTRSQRASHYRAPPVVCAVCAKLDTTLLVVVVVVMMCWVLAEFLSPLHPSLPLSLSLN